MEPKRVDGAVLRRLEALAPSSSDLCDGILAGRVRTLLAAAFAAPSHRRHALIDEQRGVLGAEFAAFGREHWARACDVLLPCVRDSAVAAIEGMHRRPFQVGMTRLPFRAPVEGPTLADLRARWLLRLTQLLGDIDADILWVTDHAIPLSQWESPSEMGWLLAGAIDAGGPVGDEVLSRLLATLRGDAGSAPMGHHVPRALMCCSRPDAWESVERLLLAAQREEGLRQSVLESVDESHPTAFRRMLRLILDHDLARFSSVVRAADTWFGFAWDGSSGSKVSTLLARVSAYLEDPATTSGALAGPDAESTYLALWSLAFGNIEAAIPSAIAMLDAEEPAMRFAATHLLVEALWSSALPPLVPRLLDPDLRVAWRAMDAFSLDRTAHVDPELLFSNLEALLARVPKRATPSEPILWPWLRLQRERGQVAATMLVNGGRIAQERLLPLVSELPASGRAGHIRQIAGLSHRWLMSETPPERRALTPEQRALILGFLGDASLEVREAAFDALAPTPLQDDEAQRLIALLNRKAGDLRTRSLGRLRGSDESQLLRVCERLIDDGDPLRRGAGLELLRDAVEQGRDVTRLRDRVRQLASNRDALHEVERAHLDSILGDATPATSRHDALGLLRRAAPEWPVAQRQTIVVETPGAIASAASLAALIIAHQSHEVQAPNGGRRLLVESVGHTFGPRRPEDLAHAASRIPLEAMWRQWYEERNATLRDADALELMRILVAAPESSLWGSDAVALVRALGSGSPGTRFMIGLCEWCLSWDPPSGAIAFLLDGLEHALSALTEEDFRALSRQQRMSYSFRDTPEHERRVQRADAWLRRVRWWRDLVPTQMRDEHAARLYRLLRGFEARSEGFAMLRVNTEDFLAAYRGGHARADDLVDLLIGRWSLSAGATLLHTLSVRRLPPAIVEHADLVEAIATCRQRIVAVETQRGDREGAASRLAMELRWTGGLETLLQALPALDDARFVRTFGWFPTEVSRAATLSHLLVRSFPTDDDTPERFSAWVRTSGVRTERLVELAVYAPQWAAYVNDVLRWPGLEDAVWWIHAHTKDDRSWRFPELRDFWAAQVSERTPLSANDLTEGAVDVAWFRRCFAALGDARWSIVDAAAKYAASSAGHTRAQLFANAMCGRVTDADLLARIASARHQDSVRALGLLPLGPETSRESVVQRRYQRLVDFIREARQFGAQRQQSETRAATIGLANLARTAGYRDPQRLEWAMEQQAVADLAQGPVVATRGAVQVTLAIDADGVPSLTTTKQGKSIKAIPAAVARDPEVAAMKTRVGTLRQQSARVRASLEASMCRGDVFTGAELALLSRHPLLGPAIARLVFLSESSMGYPDQDGRVLRNHDGAIAVVGPTEALRIAHPHDLFVHGEWTAWQRECFRAERIQPFKQVFRELYPITDTERSADRTRRYAGQQVNPRQSLALLGGRGWVARPDEGVIRTFHDEGITVHLGFQEAFQTPADIEGLTLEDVVFSRKGDWSALPITDIPPRLFSESMRDLDLVVSVAHRGGVDPEATASTIEARSTLVRETVALLRLENVTLKGHHVLIRGERAEYAVHLGSAGVVVLPGTAIPIVAVHSQHRGRLFLPFVDDDPRSAEVLAKVLMLARDTEIRDPNILEWIRAARG